MAQAPTPPTRQPLISRQATFSAGRHLANPHWDEAQNRAVFARDFLPHGHDYVVQVAYAGAISSLDGMICNLADLKPAIGQAVALLDGKFLDEEVAEFADVRPTAENIARFLWEKLPKQVGGGTLTRIRLQESRRVWVELVLSAPNATVPAMKVSRSYEFAAAHRLYTPKLSEVDNKLRFDKCANLAGHGHNYQVEVTVQGTPDRDSGYVITPVLLDKIVDEEVYQRFDHKHLNEDCPEFKDLVPTSENLAQVIFELLQQRLRSEGYELAKIGLHETQKNYFEVEA